MLRVSSWCRRFWRRVGRGYGVGNGERDIMGYEEWNFASIGKEYYGSGKKLHDFLRVSTQSRKDL
jgi:hypothetical protein